MFWIWICRSHGLNYVPSHVHKELDTSSEMCLDRIILWFNTILLFKEISQVIDNKNCHIFPSSS